MPFDVGESINGVADAILRAPIVHTVSRNPIYTALVITFIIVLIVMFIFRDVDSDESLLVLCLRSGFWVFLMLVGTLFLHNKVLVAEHYSMEKTAAYEGLFDESSGAPSLEDSIVPVSINTDFSS